MPKKEVKRNLRYSSRTRAQSSVEFLVLAGVMAFFFTIFLAVVNNKIIDLQIEHNDKRVNGLCDTIRTEPTETKSLYMNTPF